ncbi:hypothetical protein Glove_232g91 [Diversispora epigaea]|uniref:Uncharacterized protein n=1 Tax=Diversispora epigaea TaxID=1348612 RepID=A0A397IKK7_9GLOM|nr:hypothetical protein Glove_232g91 [Diversispora epigaea]
MKNNNKTNVGSTSRGDRGNSGGRGSSGGSGGKELVAELEASKKELDQNEENFEIIIINFKWVGVIMRKNGFGFDKIDDTLNDEEGWVSKPIP